MKVVIKKVVINNDEFVLIKDTQAGLTYYGTIPYSEIDDNGRLKRRLYGYEMAVVLLDDCVERNESPVCAAIKEREKLYEINKGGDENGI